MSMIGPFTSSGRKTGDAAICDRNCVLGSVILEGDGTNAAYVILYDNATGASGTVLAKLMLKANSGDMTISFENHAGIVAQNGIYADVNGTGAAFIVHYAPL